MDDVSDALPEARVAHQRREWAAARAGYIAARADGQALSADDLDALGDSCWWLGLGDESVEFYEQAYRLFITAGRRRAAAMSAGGAAVTLFLRGDETLGSGWMARADRLLADEPECAEQGYLLYGALEGTLAAGDLEATVTGARRLQELGRRHDDPALVGFGVLSEGRALVRQGKVREGTALLDEAMLVALSDDLAPAMTGNIYCHLVAACWELGDLRRAREWTDALARWLGRMPAAVVFAGICRVHRAQLLQVQGDWPGAEQEATRACTDADGIHLATAAEGWYAIGDIRRLRGELVGAEAAYKQSHRLGRDPQPGRALLQLAHGRVDAAFASIRSALAAESGGLLRQVPLLAAEVEIALVAGDMKTAGAASASLDSVALTYAGPGLVAAAGQARGAVLLARGVAAEALPVLRAACGLWTELGAPYEVARTRILLARAYRELGDEDAVALEHDAAEEVFLRLGATLDAERITRQRSRPSLPDGLTPREAEVLALVATGRSNREVAAALAVSEKTVARHLSNVFTKLGLSSRTAATAYAFERGLVPTSRR